MFSRGFGVGVFRHQSLIVRVAQIVLLVQTRQQLVILALPQKYPHPKHQQREYSIPYQLISS